MPFFTPKPQHNSLAESLKRSELNNAQIRNELEYAKKTAFHYQKEQSRLAARVAALCRLLLEHEHAKNQLGSTNAIDGVSAFDLMDRAEQAYKSHNAHIRQLLLNLTEQLEEKERIILGLDAQISRTLIRQAQEKEFAGEEGAPKIPDPVAEGQDEDEDEHSRKAVQTTSISILDDDEEPEVLPTAKLGPGRPSAPSPRQDRPQGRPTAAPPFPPPSPAVQPPRPPAQSSPPPAPVASPSPAAGPQLAAPSPVVNAAPKSAPVVVPHLTDLRDTMRQISDIMWTILSAIGEDGLSENKDIKRKVVTPQGTITESAFNTALVQLRKMGLINQEKINTGWRWFYSFELSETGRRIYLENFRKNPVECEKQLLQKDHATALHGYCIKDAAYILQAVHGYDEAIIDRKSNAIPLLGKSGTYIPDIVGRKKDGGRGVVDYFEVELGHHVQKDFEEKCDKMFAVTKRLYFIANDATTLHRTLVPQVGKWEKARGRDNLAGVDIYLTTMTKLNNEGKWEVDYHF